MHDSQPLLPLWLYRLRKGVFGIVISLCIASLVSVAPLARGSTAGRDG